MILLALILLLLSGGFLAWLVGLYRADTARWVSLAVLAVAGLLVAVVWQGGTLQNVEAGISGSGLWYSTLKLPWIPRFGISLLLAVDGLSLMLIALTIFLGVVAVVSSWNQVEYRHGFFQFNILWTLAGVVGVFAALDLFLFFVFWEVMLIPMYLLIAIWGHEDRAYASMKFFLFTQVSGLLLLVSILVLAFAHYQSSGVLSFSYFDLLNTELSKGLAFWLMLGFFVAFVVKLPGVPLHTWLPDAHTQAPTAGSVILAGILLKTGAYGLIRFVVPLFPEAAIEFRWPAMCLGAVSVVYGGYLAYAQNDFKRLVAYSSISHMGFVLLGVFAWNAIALQGAIMQMIAHGFSTAALFMLAGALQERLHTRDLDKMGGIWMQAPRMGAVALFFIVASLGMPGLGNFVGEFMVLIGIFAVDIPLTVVAALGLVIAAIYGLSLMQRAFQGHSHQGKSTVDASVPDFGLRELSVMAAMMVALVYLGVYPQPLFDMAAPVVEHLLSGGAP